jgi:multiple antibiotic resistance protein
VDLLKTVAAWPFVHGFLFVTLALFPIVNPPGMAPIFLNYTESLDEAVARSLARRVAINAFILAAASLIVGPLALKFFGLNLSAVRVAGGLVLASAGWHLLSKGQEDSKHRAPAASEDEVLGGAFYPLTLPLTIGPGSIAIMVTIGSSMLAAPGSSLLLDGLGALAGLACISIVIYLCYSQGEHVLRKLGPTGVNVLLRLSAFILLCIGVQIALEGYTAILSARP